MNHRGKWMFLFSILVVVTTSLLIINGQQKEITKGSSDQKTPATLEQVTEMPVVAFENAKQEARNPSRETKNRRHNSPVSPEGLKRPALNENAEPLLLDLPLTHQRTEPAIPVASNLIVIGSIEEAKAYLSSDETTVYSEVTIRVGQTLKGEVRYGLVDGATLTAERTGGGVRFASGKIVRRGALGKNIPIKGSRYLLFLNEIKEAEGFSIVTGYKLQNGSVFPLDGVGGTDGGFSQFAAYKTYKNAAESTLIEDVRKAVAEEANAKNGRAQ